MKRSDYNQMVRSFLWIPIGKGIICMAATLQDKDVVHNVCGRAFTKTKDGIQLCYTHENEMHEAAHRG